MLGNDDSVNKLTGERFLLVLDDLTEKGFAMAEGDITLEDTYVKLALKTLARMHASSMLLERIKTKPLATVYPELFREVLYDEAKPRSPTSRWITWQVDDLLLGIDYLDKYTHQQKEYIKANFASAIRRIYPLNKQSTRYVKFPRDYQVILTFLSL